MDQPVFTMRAVVRQTGLSAHTIRAWERRYGAIRPERTGTNRRLYSEDDVERLRLLARAVERGHSIGNIAGLALDRLKALAGPAEALVVDEPRAGAEGADASAHALACLEAVRAMDGAGLAGALARAGRDLGTGRVVDQVVVPLLEAMGEGWRSGSWRVAHEHLATSAVRSYLGRLLAQFRPTASAPVLVAATPAGQLHEMGSLLACLAAAAEGWNAVYLGPNLPADEIAMAARTSKARAVLLSIVYPPDDPRLPDELTALCQQMDPATALVIGGRSAERYREQVGGIGVHFPGDLAGLRAALEQLR